MTRRLFEDSSNRALLDFTTMFGALTPEYRLSLVIRSLRARDHVSTEAGRALDSAIRGSIRLVGYSNPALAISSALLEPVNAAIVKSEKLASASLRVWAESLEELEKLVAGHLSSQGYPTDYPDFENNRFRGLWDQDEWQRQLDWIIELSEAWTEEDVALMLCYVSGRTIDVEGEEDYDDEEEEAPVTELANLLSEPEAGEPEEVAEEEVPASPQYDGVQPTESPIPEPARPAATLAPPPREPRIPSEIAEIDGPSILNHCIEFLSSLSPEDSNWNDSVPSFLEAVSSIRTLKSAQRQRRASLVEAHGEIIHEFSADLDFLEQDTSFWNPQDLTELSELDRTLDLAGSLKSLLHEYRDVRRPGNTLTEELGRRERRFALEPRIIDTMALMRQAMSGGRRGRSSANPEGESLPDNLDSSNLSFGRSPGAPSSEGPRGGNGALEEQFFGQLGEAPQPDPS